MPDLFSGIFFGGIMSIRQQILDTIALNQPLTARDITNKLDTKHETVKMTLSKLYADDKVLREEIERPVGSKGKVKVYQYRIK